MAFLESNGARLHYELYGESVVGVDATNAKRAVILTHGAAMDLRQWQPQYEALSRTSLVVGWDVRGHGESTLPPGPVDAEFFSQDLIALLDHLAIDKAVLVGLSMGGHISLQTAVRYPARAAGLVLLGTPFSNSRNWLERLTVSVNKTAVRLFPYQTTISMTASAASPAEVDNRAYVESAFRKIPKERFLRLWAAVLSMESAEDLGKVQCPTFVLQGEKDRLVARQQRALVEGIQDARHQMIADAGHLTNLDNPEAVNEAILTFVDDVYSRPQ